MLLSFYIPGRLTLTNYALYFEASGVIQYDDAIKIDLSRTLSRVLNQLPQVHGEHNFLTRP